MIPIRVFNGATLVNTHNVETDNVDEAMKSVTEKVNTEFGKDHKLSVVAPDPD